MDHMDLLMRLAHQECARRDNASTVALKVAYHGNGGNLPGAVAAACSTLGGRHAPIPATMRWVGGGYPAPLGTVPGFGNSFVKGEPDSGWDDVDTAMKDSPYHKEYRARVRRVMGRLHLTGKSVFPNAAAYTAIWALARGVSPNVAIATVIGWRLPVWADICDKIDHDG